MIDSFGREIKTNAIERFTAALDIYEIMRFNNRGLCYYENGLYALRVWNEAVVLIKAESEAEAEILADYFNRVSIKKARKRYQDEKRLAEDLEAKRKDSRRTLRKKREEAAE